MFSSSGESFGQRVTLRQSNIIGPYMKTKMKDNIIRFNDKLSSKSIIILIHMNY